ncbi:MAG: P1 family peptidase [Segniliparus sp.]|uniref:P1 family peptidase n=1 Tax=Segniliparus sp. TaxID=2804064 RepID=UPI003F322234
MAESVAGDRITDVSGVLVGHHQRIDLDSGWATGTTAVLVPEGAVAAVDVRGGAPGTRETDALSPGKSVTKAHAVVLSGGSAYGLATADGAMRWLEERGHGVTGPSWGGVVPIVPAAVLFDLPFGAWSARPDSQFGYLAAEAAGAEFATGVAGAGTGATAGQLKGGIGTASTVVRKGLARGARVGAIMAVNSSGSVYDPETGRLWGESAFPVAKRTFPALPEEALVMLAERERAKAEQLPIGFNTTIGVVATDAALTREACLRLAGAAQDGLARAVRPAHGPFDGDVVFALSTKDEPRPFDPLLELSALSELCEAAAICVERAIVDAVVSAASLGGYPSHSSLALPKNLG